MAKKTALVLSAGGYFGAYQIGVWKVLARELQIDLVAGASVGALNGWLIAARCPVANLEQRWLDPATASHLTFHPKPGVRNGFFQSAPLLHNVEELHREYTPVIPFGLVAVELPRLHQRLFRTPQVTPRHLLATCSIPFILPSVKIDGRRYTDGGLLEKLPLWAAVQMGADEIIAIDSLPPVTPWWVHAGTAAVRLVRPRRGVPPGVRVTVIAPSEPMGTARDAVIWKRENIERWLAMGERDAARVFALQ
jgi:NTE family protein